MNKQEVRKLGEITVIAMILFAGPVVYVNYREKILQKWNSAYYR